jgi:uncharacterized protein
MSANDPLPEPTADDAIRLRPAEVSPDLPEAPPPGYTADVYRPALAPADVRRPQPHPGFWWSLLWCLGFLAVTQIPGTVIGLVLMLVLSLARPDLVSMRDLADPKALMHSSGFSLAMGVAFCITEILVIGVSWLVIRLVVGRDWTRQLALRRPGLAHVALVLVSFPALPLLGDWVYMVLRDFLHVPSLSSFGMGDMEQMVEVFARWPVALGVLIIGVGPGIGEELWCRPSSSASSTSTPGRA